MNLDTILIILALVCFAAATINVNARVNLIGAGLFLWLLTSLT